MRNTLPFQIPVFLFLVACGEQNDKQTASGIFEATEIVVSSEANGKIISLYAEEGNKLKADELAGIIDSTSLQLSKIQLEAHKKAVLAGRPDVGTQIEVTKKEIAKSERERKRTENLLAGDVATQKQLDDINAQLEVLYAKLQSQKSSLYTQISTIEAQANAIDAQIIQVADQIGKCRLTSPVDGTVLVQYAEPGEVTAMGKALFKIADLDHMILRAYVTGDMLSILKIGQKVSVLAEMGEEDHRTYEGRIAWIAGEAEFTPKTIQTQDKRANLVYAVKIAVENDGFLKIGMYGSFESDAP